MIKLIREHNPKTLDVVSSLYDTGIKLTTNGHALCPEIHKLYTDSINAFSTAYSVINHFQKNTEYPENDKTNVIRAMSIIMLCVAGGYYKTKSVIDTSQLIKMNIDLSNPIRALDSLSNELESHLNGVTDITSLDHKIDIWFMSLLSIANDEAKNNSYVINNRIECEFDDAMIKGHDVLEKIESKIFSKPVYFKQIVGNDEVKKNAIKTISSVFCYDFERQKNPAYELFGMPSITKVYGQTGTGKSMEGSAIATRMQAWSYDLGIPFMNNEVPGNFISKYQGESGDKMDAVWKNMDNPRVLMLTIFDEIDNYLCDRGGGSSEGSQAVTNSFLRNTEGSFAHVLSRGNNVIRAYTNRPEVIDPAVNSRIQLSIEATGPTTSSEFMELDDLTLYKYVDKLAPGFNDLSYIDDNRTSAYVRPEVERNASQLVDEIVKSIPYKIGTKNFFAELNVKFKQQYNNFGPRHIRNIHNLVKSRLGDFELPLEWFIAGNEHKFLALDYDNRIMKLQELVIDNMEGHKLSDILYDVTIETMTTFATTNNKRN